MGLLGDIFSEIDRKKRQLKGLLSDPAETIYQGIRNFGADQQGLLDTQAQAYPMIATPEQKKRIAGFARTQDQAKKELADAGAAQGMAAATVWHGSPHKFDKFDSSKIGTGEGAQAYGHGLYLADAPDVAQSYAGKAAAQIDKRADGSFLAMVLDPSGKPVAKKSFLDKTAAMDFAKAEQSKFGYGSLYKVDLPDEHIAKMLDWDKPLSQQAPEVQAAAQKLGYPIDRTGGDFQRWASSPSGGLSMNLRGPKDQSGLEKQAADVLRQAGIPGIRYLDQGSRNAGQFSVTPPSNTISGKWMVKGTDYSAKGMHFDTEAEALAKMRELNSGATSNYVVFPGNEDILKILERNGQGLLGP